MERRRCRWCSAGALAIGVGVSAAQLIFINGQSPVADWFAISYAVVLFWQLLLNLAFLAGGTAITERFVPKDIPFLERLTINVATGVAAFYVCQYALGALHLFVPWAAVALVLAFIAAGASPLFFWVREHIFVQNENPSLRRRVDPLAWALGAAGILGVTLVYLGGVTPNVINYDASWYHLPAAESYAREGRVVSFDGNWHREYPHLTAILHTYAFLVPGLAHPALRWMLLLHTEFALFVWTLVGIAAAANWMARSTRVRGAWAAMFLFPGIFVYDGNIGGAADHIIALFAAPLFLLAVRAPRWESNRPLAIWGALAGAAVMTKYQGIYFAIPLGVALLVGVLTVGRDLRPLDLRFVRSASWVVCGFVVVIAPHFLKNIICHGNPVYPLKLDWFPHSHPVVRDARILVENIVADRNWRAPKEIGKLLQESLELIWTFAFRPHYTFMPEKATFGFAFTLALPWLFVVGGRRRLLVGAAVSLGALFVWASTYRVDRHLQIFLPLLVATTAAILAKAWQRGRLAKIGVATFLAVQLAWAGDLYTLGLERAGSIISLVHSGREGRARSRFDGYFPEHQAIERQLPKGAVILLHHWHVQLGFNRKVFLDWVGFQGLIDYRDFSTPADVYEKFRQLGVTHVIHLPGVQASPQVMDVVLFDAFAFEASGPKVRAGQFEFFPLPSVPPAARPPLMVTAAGIGGYADGLYPVTALDNISSLPGEFHHFNSPQAVAGSGGIAELAKQSDAVVTNDRAPADGALAELLARQFQKVSAYPGMWLYLRTTAEAGRLPFRPNGR